MSLKFRIVFYNVMIFLFLFDILYLFVWVLSIEMGWVKTIIVACITALLMPWARKNTTPTKRKVVIRSIGYHLYKKYQTSKIS